MHRIMLMFVSNTGIDSQEKTGRNPLQILRLFNPQRMLLETSVPLIEASPLTSIETPSFRGYL